MLTHRTRKFCAIIGALAAVTIPGRVAADGMPAGSLKDTSPPPPAGIAHAADIEFSVGSVRTRSSMEFDNGEFIESISQRSSRPFIAGAARVSGPLGDALSGQIDLDARGVFARSDVSGGSDVLAGVHLASRDPSRGAVGVFGAAGVYTAATDANLWLLGVEAQRYVENWTFYGQAGLLGADIPGADARLEGGWFLRGVVRYFPDPRSRVQGYVSYARASLKEGGPVIGDVSASGSGNVHSTGWGLRFDRQIHDRPIAWFLAYDGSDTRETYTGTFDPSTTIKLTDHAFRVGLSFKFGTDTLLDNDRRGATFDLPRLPVFGTMTVQQPY